MTSAREDVFRYACVISAMRLSRSEGHKVFYGAILAQIHKRERSAEDDKFFGVSDLNWSRMLKHTVEVSLAELQNDFDLSVAEEIDFIFQLIEDFTRKPVKLPKHVPSVGKVGGRRRNYRRRTS